MRSQARGFVVLSLLFACGGDDPEGPDPGESAGSAGSATDGTGATTGPGGTSSGSGPATSTGGEGSSGGSDGTGGSTGGADTTTDGSGTTGGGGAADCGPSRGAGGPTGENAMMNGSYPESWMYAPPGRTDPLPLVVSLQGSGDDPYNFNWIFLGAAQQDEFLLVTPGPTNPMGWNLQEDEEVVFAAIEAMKERHNVDTCRIYVAGFSAGAFYSWVLGLQFSDVFAAFGSIQGSIAYAEQFGIWPDMVERKIPASIHHGTLDGAYPDAERSRDLLEAAGHTVYFTSLAGVGHEANQEIGKGVWADMKNHSLED